LIFEKKISYKMVAVVKMWRETVTLKGYIKL